MNGSECAEQALETGMGNPKKGKVGSICKTKATAKKEGGKRMRVTSRDLKNGANEICGFVEGSVEAG